MSPLFDVSPGIAEATLICSKILSGSQASFDTNTILGGNIPSFYHHLEMVVYGRFSLSDTNAPMAMQFNNDSSAIYDYIATTLGSSYTGSQNVAATAMVVGNLPGANATANRFGQSRSFIAQYAGTTGDKMVTSQWSLIRGTSATDVFSGYNTGGWRSTAAINRLAVFDSQAASNFIAGSAFYLYGIL